MTSDRHESDSLSDLRTRAKELLKTETLGGETAPTLSQQEARQLVHELDIHRIELEIQNEELRRTQVQLEELNDRYLNLYEFAPVGYLTLNDKGLILEANLTATRLLGVEKRRLLKRFFSSFVCREDLGAGYLHLKRVLATKSKQTCEIRLTRGDGAHFLAQLETVPVLTEGGEPSLLRMILMNITERKAAEEQRFSAIFEGAKDYIFIKDSNLRYVQVNPAFAGRWGKDPGDFLGRTAEDVCGTAEGLRIKDLELRALGGESLEGERTLTIEGQPVVYNFKLSPVKDVEGKTTGIFGIVRDVTGRRPKERYSTKKANEYPSKAMQVALSMAHLTARHDSVVLLLGESGSGKDYVAKYIHDHSHRKNGPYFSLNCATIPPEIAESELFGHERGAFTGAVGRKRGILELAEGGSLLLNEIGELSLPLQAKLLAFLDTKKFTRVGGEKEISVNARLMAATNRDLEKQVGDGRFRKDLFYRLNVIRINIPPLRERLEDIPALVDEITSRLATEMQFTSIPPLDRAALNSLAGYAWPGNVRELRNVLERALILSDRGEVDLNSLLACIYNGGLTNQESFFASFPFKGTLEDATDELTKSLLIETLKHYRGNKRKTASTLGISRDSLYRYIKKFGLERGA
jgi:PAS domain S-box-containing protein